MFFCPSLHFLLAKKQLNIVALLSLIRGMKQMTSESSPPFRP